MRCVRLRIATTLKTLTSGERASPVLLIVVALICQFTLFGLAALYYRRPWRRSWMRMRVNPFRRHAPVLFLHRAACTGLLVLLTSECLMRSVVAVTESARAASAEIWSLVWALIHCAFYLYLAVWIGRIFRWMQKSGLLQDLRLSRTTVQEALTPVFWKICGTVALFLGAGAVPDLALRGSLHLLPLEVAVGMAESFALVAFLFCAFSHGLGTVQTLCLGAVMLTLLLGPLSFLLMLAKGSLEVGMPLVLLLNCVVYLLAGRLFYVSFQRTNPDRFGTPAAVAE